MTYNESKQKAPPMELYPHQAAFLDMFFSPNCKRQILLKGGYGTGKTTVLNAVAQEFLKQRPSARVLLMAPEGLLSYFGEKLSETKTPLQVVERYLFREMLDSKDNVDFWPTGQVTLIGLDFAKKQDIHNSLFNIKWDLIIIDESAPFIKSLIELFNTLTNIADRIIITSPLAIDIDKPFLDKGITIVEWGPDAFRAKLVPPPVLHEIFYSLTPLELSIQDKVNALFRILNTNIPSQNFIAKSLLKSLQSSPSALEGILQNLLDRYKYLGNMPISEDLVETDLPEILSSTTDTLDIIEVQEIAANAIQENYDVDRDSKLGAFNGLLSRINEGSDFSARICVVTEYVSTLYYLATEIENQGAKCILLHGRMSLGDRQSSISQFNKDGGLLITTVGPLQGFELSDASDLVFYDTPGNKEALWIVLSRFDRIGRSIQLNMHVLLPDNNVNIVMDESLGLLRKIIIEAYSVRQDVAQLGHPR